MNADETYAEAMKLYRDGAMNDAASMLEQARGAFLAQGEEAKAATAANDLGVVYYLTGRRDEARRILEETQATFEKQGDVSGQARVIGNLAHLMNRAGEKDDAEKHYVHAADLFHQVGDGASEHDTYRALSAMQMQRGRWLESLAAYDHALAAKGGSGALRAFLQIPLKLLGAR